MADETLAIPQFEERKRDHIQHALDPRNEALGGSGLDRVRLHHQALPECDFEEISITHQRFGQLTTTPFIVSSMTAGHDDAAKINLHLAQACQITEWAMGVGSQRRQLTDRAAAKEWHALRQGAPDATLYANIGLSQLITSPLSAINELIESIEATALFVHTNPLQECLQPEGTPQFKHGFAALANACEKLQVPVILKETGCGFAPDTLLRLHGIGLAAVDVSGFGGTHWGRIEGARVAEDSIIANAAETFKNWGISTVDSVIFALGTEPDYEVWASGGVRNGLDAARLLLLGADTIGMAKPMLQAALHSTEAVVTRMRTVEYELKIALFCTGNRDIAELQQYEAWEML